MHRELQYEDGPGSCTWISQPSGGVYGNPEAAESIPGCLLHLLRLCRLLGAKAEGLRPDQGFMVGLDPGGQAGMTQQRHESSHLLLVRSSPPCLRLWLPSGVWPRKTLRQVDLTTRMGIDAASLSPETAHVDALLPPSASGLLTARVQNTCLLGPLEGYLIFG